jgi:hypothetical protein
VGVAGQRLADVLPLSESAPATVATFLTLARADEGSAAAPPPVGDTGGVSDRTAIAINAAVLLLRSGGGEEAAPEGEVPAPVVKNPVRDAEAVTDSLTIGVDEALQRSGAALREQLLGEDGLVPQEVPGDVLGEVFRRWRDDLEVVGQRLLQLQSGVDLRVPAEALVKVLAEMADPLTDLSGSGPARGLIDPFLPAPAAGASASPGERQRPGDGSEAGLGEDGSTLPKVLAVAGLGLGSLLWHYRPTVDGHRIRRR